MGWVVVGFITRTGTGIFFALDVFGGEVDHGVHQREVDNQWRSPDGDSWHSEVGDFEPRQPHSCRKVLHELRWERWPCPHLLSDSTRAALASVFEMPQHAHKNPLRCDDLEVVRQAGAGDDTRATQQARHLQAINEVEPDPHKEPRPREHWGVMD